MMPMWMFTLGQKLTQGASMQVPYGNLVLSLISLTVPIGLGVALRAWRPKWADRGAKIIKPFTLVVILLFIDLAALPAMATMLQVGPPMILLYAVLTILRRYCGCCPVEEEQKAVPADEKHMEAERAREIEAFLSKPDKNIFTDSVMKENEKQYGLVLQGMTKLKLAGDMQETNIV
ncbi:hypothetical protein E2C01_038759 [Portunus trituberculatus]|uniref:Uncharacterized protein n=1 Tax=Portunus trituberculatus TaxID=210409 RepID=A0A5B7FKX6_PORTR|nr:hypothetical protein [Portunus trituberculatus]